jgi:hypothetical protein
LGDALAHKRVEKTRRVVNSKTLFVASGIPNLISFETSSVAAAQSLVAPKLGAENWPFKN